jgi:prevent-host-death family protein
MSLSDADPQLRELIRRVQAGDDVLVIDDGHPTVRITAVAARATLDQAAKLALIEDIQRSARAKRTPGPGAARSQDFLYDEDGLPA